MILKHGFWLADIRTTCLAGPRWKHILTNSDIIMGLLENCNPRISISNATSDRTDPSQTSTRCLERQCGSSSSVDFYVYLSASSDGNQRYKGSALFRQKKMLSSRPFVKSAVFVDICTYFHIYFREFTEGRYARLCARYPFRHIIFQQSCPPGDADVFHFYVALLFVWSCDVRGLSSMRPVTPWGDHTIRSGVSYSGDYLGWLSSCRIINSHHDNHLAPH